MGVEWWKGQRGKRGDRLSRGASLATIAGLPVAVVTLLLAFLTLGGDEGSTSQSIPGRGQLERIDLIARNGPAPARPALELMVHNGGAGNAVVSRAQIEIVKTVELPLCFTQGDFPTSEGYGAQLPVDADPGTVIETPLHQQVGPGANDRFRIDLGVVGGDEEGTLRGLYLFELAVSLVHDGESDSLPMGTAILSLPSLPFAGVYYLEEGELADLEASYDMNDRSTPEEMWPSVMPCWQANGKALLDAGGATAIRSPQLTEVFRRAIVPDYSEGEA